MKKTIVSLILILAGSVAAVKQADGQVFSVGVSLRVGPPVIPVYTQPPCPVDGYIWVPGYWAYDDDYGYFWVPGYWAEPPEAGYLWTPGYWGYAGGLYGWHPGYWGPHIGFYGGVNYGCGYYGAGYVGGGWVGGRFRYNTAVTNVNRTIVHNTYIDRTVIRNTTVNRVSYNGGPGGVNARPTAGQEVAGRDRHIQATAAQLSQQHNASTDRNQFASVNRGRPSQTAVERPTAYRPANTRAQLSRAPMSRPGNNADHPAPGGGVSTPAGRSVTPVDHGVRHAMNPVNHPQPTHTEPARPVAHPQPARPEQARPVARPQTARPEPSRPVTHPQPMHTNPQPMRRTQPQPRPGPVHQAPQRPVGHPQPPRPAGHPGAHPEPPHGGGDHHR